MNEIEICNLYKTGLSMQKIANKLGYSKSTIYRIISKFGIKKPSLPKDEIISLYKSGISALQLSKKYECSRNKIVKLLNDNNVEKQRNRLVIELDKKLCNEDFSVKNIMKTHNISKNTTIKLRNRNNITTNNSVLDIDIKELIRLHIKEKKSASEIAEIFNCYYGTIINKLGDSYNPNLSKSSSETKVREFLQSLNINFQVNNRTIIKPKELDFYLPEHNLAIEVNGIYWHGELKGKNKKYHIEKFNQCQEKNIILLQFSDVEILTKFDIVKSMIKSRLGMNERIFARQTTFKNISFIEAKNFMNDNHISGHCVFSKKESYGLFFNDELVSVMTLMKNRFEKKNKYEIIRFATKLNTTVVGGLSKLIFNQPHKNIISYSNNKYGDGKSYEKCGFNLIKNIPAGYNYSKNGLLYSRQTFQKHKLKNELEIFKPELTEWENMKLNGYDRIWNCGNKKWELKR